MGTSVYDEVELLDCEFSEEEETFFYPCPCGDRFRITVVSCSQQFVGQ